MRRYLITFWIMLLALGLPLPSSATTEFICTTNHTGEDYSSVGTWEAAMDDVGDLTASDVLVFSHGGITGAVADGASVTGANSSATGSVIHATATQILIDAISGTFQSGEQVQVDGANYVTISDAGDDPILTLHVYDDDGVLPTFYVGGTTQSATNYLHITAPEGERHNGTDNGAATINGNANTNVMRIDDTYTKISWLIIEDGESNYGYGWCIHINTASGAPVYIENNVIHDCKGGNGGYSNDGIYAPYGVRALNNIMYDISDRGIQGNTSFTQLIYNNTIYSVGNYGVQNGQTVRNNICVDAPIACYSGGSRAYNASDDSSATGTGSVTGITSSIFVNAAGYDLHLVSGATAVIDAGTDLGSYYATDIDGDVRSGTWDMGADEYVSAGGGGTSTDDGTRVFSDFYGSDIFIN